MKRSELKKIIKEEVIKLREEKWSWKDPEFQNAKEVYHGQIFTAGKDYFFTVKDKKLWKFVYGFKDKKNPPYVKFVKKVNIKFPSGDNSIEYNGEQFWPIGNTALYKLKNGKILWEY